jgi:hypothetical protein
VITAMPGTSGQAVLSGLQMMHVVAPQLSVKPTPKGNLQGGFAFTFTGDINRPYQIEYTDNPVSGVWTPLAIVTPTQLVTTFTDPTLTNATMRFYRVVALPSNP